MGTQSFLVSEARKIQTAADLEKRPLTREEEDRIHALLDAAKESAPRPVCSPTGPSHQPIVGDDWKGGTAEPGIVRPIVGAKYFDLFPGAPRDLGGFRSSAEFFDVVGLGQAHPALRPSAAMSTQTGGSGGYIVPSPLAGAMWDSAVEQSVLLSRATTYAMSADTLRVAAWDQDTITDTEMAGFTLQFLGELESATRSTGKMRAITLHAHRAAIYAQASLELASDGQDFESQLTSKLSSALARGIDITLLRGTGSGQPLGVLNAPCTISVTKETGQTASTLVYENIVNMYSRMMPSSVSRSVWLAHPSTTPQLLQMTLGIGTSGVWMPVLNQDGSGGMSLLGRPVILTEQCSALGTKGDIFFLDPTAILCGMRQEVTLERSTIPGWLENAVDWRCQIRIDAQPALSAAQQGPRGSTLSPFVTLDART